MSEEDSGYVVRYQRDSRLGRRFPTVRYPASRALPRDRAEELRTSFPSAAIMEVVAVDELETARA